MMNTEARKTYENSVVIVDVSYASIACNRSMTSAEYQRNASITVMRMREAFPGARVEGSMCRADSGYSTDGSDFSDLVAQTAQRIIDAL